LVEFRRRRVLEEPLVCGQRRFHVAEAADESLVGLLQAEKVRLACEIIAFLCLPANQLNAWFCARLVGCVVLCCTNQAIHQPINQTNINS
jgi:hypothetical protein